MNWFTRTMLAVFTATLLLGVGCAVANACATRDDLSTAVVAAKGSLFTASPADKQKIVDAFGAPPIDEPYDVEVLFMPGFSRLVLFKDGCMIGLSKAFTVREIRNVLGLEEARL